MKEKNFKFRAGFGKLVANMTDKQAGEFIKAISGYVFENKPMESKDEYLKGVFLFAKNVLDTDMQNRENGKLGGALIAERRKAMKTKQMASETNVISQVVLVSSDKKVYRGLPDKAEEKPAAKCGNESRRNV